MRMIRLTQRLFPTLFGPPRAAAGSAAPTIATRRLLLRPLSADDAPALNDLYADPAVTAYLQNGPYDPAKARRVARKALAAAIEEDAVFGHTTFAVLDRATAEFVGCCGISLLPLPGSERIELSYLLARRFWGGGLMAEAATAVIGDSFGRLAIPRLFALSDPRNLASIRLLRRLGFADAGTLRCYGRKLPCYVLDQPVPGQD